MYKKLKNGEKLPLIGYGTYKTQEGEDGVSIFKEAIRCGYRLIDTASFYGNEKSVGEAIRSSGVKREDITVTSKLWNDRHGYDNTLRAFEETLKSLDLEYVDIYLIHWPIPKGHKEDYIKLNNETWRAMERIYDEGLVKTLGVSNFLTHHLEPLMKNANIPVCLNQLELNPVYPQNEIRKYCFENNIIVEGWGPLGRGKLLDKKQIIQTAEKYNKTPAQICLRWSIEKGIIPLPKASSEKRMKENMDVFDFSLAKEDMDYIDTLNTLDGFSHHPDMMD